MRKRDTVLALLALGAAPFIVKAQPAGKVWRIGYLTLASGPDQAVDALREQLRTLGYVEGRNLAFEVRWAAGKVERLPELAAELVRLKVGVIVTRTTFVALAAKRATSTIPIVMALATDPVGAGVVASLARPGGNVTGLSMNSIEMAGKRLQLLRELIPKATRFAILTWKDAPTEARFMEQIRAAARQMGVTLILQAVSTPEELAGAFSAMQREHAQGLIVQTTPFTSNNRKQIVALTVQHRLPVMFEGRTAVDAGGLMSYGPSIIEMHRRAAYFVDRILKGAKPADLPVEEPTQFEMVINGKTAKALGITIPQAVLLRATELIQ